MVASSAVRLRCDGVTLNFDLLNQQDTSQQVKVCPMPHVAVKVNMVQPEVAPFDRPTPKTLS